MAKEINALKGLTDVPATEPEHDRSSTCQSFVDEEKRVVAKESVAADVGAPEVNSPY